jgi:hypothetical protein
MPLCSSPADKGGHLRFKVGIVVANPPKQKGLSGFHCHLVNIKEEDSLNPVRQDICAFWQALHNWSCAALNGSHNFRMAEKKHGKIRDEDGTGLKYFDKLPRLATLLFDSSHLRI